jgi:hypothetical protein
MAVADRRRRLSGWLALLALALQLAVSFGHMHREDFVHGRPGTTVLTQGAGGAGTPIDGDDDHLTCDICATVHLAGTLLLPAPPAIALPAEITIARLTAGQHPATQRTTAIAFNARGPPSS